MPLELMPPIKGVSCFCVDSSVTSQRPSSTPSLYYGSSGPGHANSNDEDLPPLCVVKRRLLLLYDCMDVLRVEKEYQLSGGALTCCRQGDNVCLADQESYHLLNLRTRRSMPLIPVATSQSNRRGGPSGVMMPFTKVCGPKEFLIVNATPESHLSLGVVVTARGEPTRGTLQWPAYPRSVEVVYPYVIAILPVDTIMIHNLLDQRMVQQIKVGLQFRSLHQAVVGIPSAYAFNKKAAASIGSGGGNGAAPMIRQDSGSMIRTQIYIAAKDSISALYPASLKEQADDYLSKGQIEQAQLLAEQYMQSMQELGEPTEEVEYVYKKCGFLLFAETLFEDAFQLFRQVRIDPRLLISLYPSIKPRACRPDITPELQDILTRCGSLSEIIQKHVADKGAEVDEEAMKKQLLDQANLVLLSYLEQVRQHIQESGLSRNVPYRQDVETTLIKLYGIYSRDKLIRFLQNESPGGDFNECRELLESKQQFYPLFILYKSKRKFDGALSIWTKHLTGELNDTGFGDMADFATMLTDTADAVLIAKYLPWVLQNDLEIGLKMMLELDETEDILAVEEAIDMLKPFGSVVVIRYLEGLIYDHKNTDIMLHTRLMEMYVSELTIAVDKQTLEEYITDMNMELARTSSSHPNLTYFSILASWSDAPSVLRTKLIRILQISRYYDYGKIAKLIEEKIRPASLETVAVYARLGKYKEALQLLVDLMDFAGAERFCYLRGVFIDDSSVNMVSLRVNEQVLFHYLLSLLLSKPDRYSSSFNNWRFGNLWRDSRLVENRTIHLISNNIPFFEISEVIGALPESWGISKAQELFISSIRRHVAKRYLRSVEKGLWKVQNWRELELESLTSVQIKRLST